MLRRTELGRASAVLIQLHQRDRHVRRVLRRRLRRQEIRLRRRRVRQGVLVCEFAGQCIDARGQRLLQHAVRGQQERVLWRCGQVECLEERVSYLYRIMGQNGESVRKKEEKGLFFSNGSVFSLLPCLLCQH